MRIVGVSEHLQCSGTLGLSRISSLYPSLSMVMTCCFLMARVIEDKTKELRNERGFWHLLAGLALRGHRLDLKNLAADAAHVAPPASASAVASAALRRPSPGKNDSSLLPNLSNTLSAFWYIAAYSD